MSTFSYVDRNEHERNNNGGKQKRNAPRVRTDGQTELYRRHIRDSDSMEPVMGEYLCKRKIVNVKHLCPPGLFRKE